MPAPPQSAPEPAAQSRPPAASVRVPRSPAPVFAGSNSLFIAASQPDMVRAVQKDAYYSAQFQAEINELGASAFGAASTRWQEEMSAVADAVYYALTTGIGGRTPGEEYCDIAPVTSEGRPVSLQRRSAFVALHVVLPYLYKRLRKNGRRVAVVSDSNVVTRASGWLWNHIVSLALQSDSAISGARRWHLALFYLVGAYLEISRRAVGLRYIYIRRLDQPRPGYHFLGVLMVLQLCTLGLISLKDTIQRWRQAQPSRETGYRLSDGSEQVIEAQSDQDDDDSGAPACPLCLSSRRRPTTTECGHVFCWSCIAECVHKKPECPLCRSPVQMNQLLALSHYQ